MDFKIIDGGVTAAKGFMALGKNCGIKIQKKDLAVIYSEKPAVAEALYTTNQIKGAPLIVTQKHLKNHMAQAIVVNSGIANVCTGQKGISDAEETARLAAVELGVKKEDVLVASTGLIGAYLPMEEIRNGLK